MQDRRCLQIRTLLKKEENPCFASGNYDYYYYYYYYYYQVIDLEGVKSQYFGMFFDWFSDFRYQI